MQCARCDKEFADEELHELSVVFTKLAGLTITAKYCRRCRRWLVTLITIRNVLVLIFVTMLAIGMWYAVLTGK